jgi:DNA modification methylase
MARYQGRLELTWTNKDRALLSTSDGRYDYEFVDPHDPRVLEVRLLHEIDRVDAETPGERPADLPAPTTDNLLITGDAMHALDALIKTPELSAKYLGKVKLVYIDPPFNTGQAFAHYEDNIEHSIWLTLLRDRIRQIKPLLAGDGSVWVHLDDVEVHRCRAVMDEELGPENFAAEVVWQKADSPRSDAKGLSVSHDSILVYKRSSQWTPNRLPRLASTDETFGNQDGDPVLWRKKDPTAPNAATHQGMVYAVQHPISGRLVYPGVGRCWAMDQTWMLKQMSRYAAYTTREIEDAPERARICGVDPANVRSGVKALMLAEPLDLASERATAMYDAGTWPELYLTGPRGARGIQRKQYISDTGRVPETWWPHSDVGHNRAAKNEIKALFPGEHPFSTPKPERLLQRIIRISTNPGDLVLDCFAGSGTTAAVAQKMGRRWITSELLPETVATFTKPRLAKVVQGQDPGGITTAKERTSDQGTALPDGVSAEEAREFTRVLGKVVAAVEDLDDKTIRAIRDVTRTKEVATQLWHGGGGFTHLEVGSSMYEVDVDGDVFLSTGATSGAWSKSVAAQLKFTLTPDHPVFCGVRGRQRLAVIDGVADEVVVRTVLEHLADREKAVIVAKAVLPEADALLTQVSPGSRLRKAPEDLFPKRTVK